MAAAANRLNDKKSKSRAIVLLTDGENNAGKIPPNTAAEAIKALKIHLLAIGAGTNGVRRSPILSLSGRPLTDVEGNIIYESARCSLMKPGLKEVAKIADGQFFRATDTKSLEEIYAEIDKMEKSTVKVKKYQQYRDLFPGLFDVWRRAAARRPAALPNHLEKNSDESLRHPMALGFASSGPCRSSSPAPNSAARKACGNLSPPASSGLAGQVNRGGGFSVSPATARPRSRDR